MIESHSDLPSQEGGSATAWERVHQAGRAIIGRVGTQIRDLGGEQIEDWTGLARQFGVSLFAGTTLRTRLGPGLHRLGSAAGDQPLLSRFALHLIVIFLAVGIVLVSQVTLPEIELSLPASTPAPASGDSAVTTSPSNRGVDRQVGGNSDATLFSAPVIHTTRAERETMEVFTYTVQPNDNLWVIANGFGLQVETIAWANPEVEKAPDLLSVGQVLVILPVDGIVHTVRPGDTIKKLAEDYKTTVQEVVGFEGNGLTEAPYVLTPGQELVLPGGRKQVVPWQKIYPMTWVGAPPKGAARGSGRFAWPARGTLTQGFWSAHLAIDIASRTGVPIYAADGGYVRMAGRDTWGYGNQIVIDHGNGFLTRYAHLDTMKVAAGQSVQKNEQIGTMGNTGRSTGPHLHFEVIQGGVKRNPLGYLP
jgi:LysM repeat protein